MDTIAPIRIANELVEGLYDLTGVELQSDELPANHVKCPACLDAPGLLLDGTRTYEQLRKYGPKACMLCDGHTMLRVLTDAERKMIAELRAQTAADYARSWRGRRDALLRRLRLRKMC